MTPSLATTVPDAVWQQIGGSVAVEAGFGAGPSFVSRKVQRFEPVVRVEDAITWLDAYCTVMRIGHVLLDDGRILYFGPDGSPTVTFLRIESQLERVRARRHLDRR